MRKQRSFLKWPGNKFNCLKHILPLLPAKGRYIEPFMGSGTVFLNTNYRHNLLAESNRDPILLFQQIQQNGLEFIAYCQSYFCRNNNQKIRYYELRQEFNICNSDTHPARRAALFLYLNRHGYNGLCRYNNSGAYNVPFGSYEKPYFPYEALVLFLEKSRKNKQIQFINQDFLKTFQSIERGDVIYCDPPYAPLEQETNFTHYAQKDFHQHDHEMLASAAREAVEKKSTVIISNHDTPYTRKLYQGAQITSFPVARFISCNGEKRRPVQELLAIFSKTNRRNDQSN
jgi:DNA adenine methylase